MEARSAVGAVVTILGLIFMLYVLAKGASTGAIGSEEAVNRDAALLILGWFMVLAGPALWFGEAPAKVRRAAGRGG
ncbi:MAG: hypothetical protein GSR85_03225 [Desulfurococcales archaeon]|nr:hypothetical protein [Desulfurococcales archaeon]